MGASGPTEPPGSHIGQGWLGHEGLRQGPRVPGAGGADMSKGAKGVRYRAVSVLSQTDGGPEPTQQVGYKWTK